MKGMWLDSLRRWSAKILADFFGGPGEVSRRVLHGTFWAGGGTVVAKFISWLAFLLAARMLGVEEFGRLGMIQSTLGFAGAVSGLALGYTATRHVAAWRDSDIDRAVGIVRLVELVAMISGFIAAGALIGGADFLADKVLKDPSLSFSLRVGAISLWVGTLGGTQSGALAGFEAFSAISLVNVVTGVANLIGIPVGAMFFGVPGAVVGLTLSNSLSCFMNKWFLKRHFKTSNRAFRWSDIRVGGPILLHFAVPAAMAGIMIIPVEWVCNARVVAGPEGYAQMGMLSAAYQWRTILMFVPTILSSVWLPVFSRNVETDSDLMRTYHRNNALIVGVLGIGICIGAPWILGMYGRAFCADEGVLVLRLVVLAMVISGVGCPASVVLAAKDRMWQGFLQNAVYAGILLAGVIPFGMSLGAVAMGMAILAGYGFQTIVCYATVADVMPRSTVIRTLAVVFLSWGAGIILILANGFL
jgi:O-antigen/teichoic acid export membrane protein